MTGRRTAGFTLIEVLLALAILSVVLTMIYSALTQTGTVIEHVDRDADKYRSGRLALAKITDELSSAYYLSADKTTTFSGQDNQSARGLDADSLVFSSMSRVLPEGAARGSFHNTVTYYVDGDVLMHTEQLDTPYSGAGNAQPFPLVEGLIGFRLRYLVPDSLEWQDGWPEDLHKLPRAVEVSLTFALQDTEEELSANEPQGLTLSTVVTLPMGAV